MVTDGIHFAYRRLAREPKFVVLSAVILALGIGVTLVTSAVVNAVLFEQPPFPHAEELVVLEHAPAVVSSSEFAGDSLLNWVSRFPAFHSIATFHTSPVGTNVGVGKAATNAQTTQVAPSFFDTLGVHFLIGNGFDQASTVANSAVISYGLWQQQFGANPLIVGSKVTLSGVPFEIAGVMPKDFAFPAGTEIWIPLQYRSGGQPTVAFIDGSFVGRIRRSDMLSEARTEMRDFSRQIQLLSPRPRSPITVTPLAGYDALAIQDALWMVFGSSLLILLLACTSVASLNSARMIKRRSELGIQFALGAGRLRLLGELFTEGFILSVLGSGTGLLVAICGDAAVRSLAHDILPRADMIHLNVGVFAFGMVLAFAGGIGSTVFPGLQITRLAPQEALDGARGFHSASRSTMGLSQKLVAVEIAIACCLLITAGLVIRSFVRLLEVSPGFRPENLVSASLWPVGPSYGASGSYQAFFKALLEKLQSMPGIESASATSQLPIASSVGATLRFTTDTSTPSSLDPDDRPLFFSVSDNYFSTMGIQLIAGRTFVPDDVNPSRHAAIVSQEFARRYWPNRNALGQRMQFLGHEYEIVGIVGDTRVFSMESPRGSAQVYIPYLDSPLSVRTIVVRSHLDVSTITSSIRTATTSIDPNIPPYDIKTMSERLSHSTGRRRLVLWMLAIAGIISIVLTLGAVVGMSSNAVVQRRREIGIRMALGAQPYDVLVLFMRAHLKLAFIGASAGILLALALRRVLQALLFGISPTDIAVFTIAPVGIMIAVLVATYWPTRQALKTNPAIAMRQ